MQVVYLKGSVVQNRLMSTETRIGYTPKLVNSARNWTGLKRLGSASSWTSEVDDTKWSTRAVSAQFRLLGVTRSVVYGQKMRLQEEVDEFKCILLNKLDD